MHEGKVYTEPYSFLEELERRNSKEYQVMRLEALRKVWENAELCLNYLSNTNRGQIECLIDNYNFDMLFPYMVCQRNDIDRNPISYD